MQKRKSRKELSRVDISLGLSLREARDAKGISQDQLAFKAGYSRSFIGYVEHGEKSPTVRTLFELCHTLGVAASEIIRKVEHAMRKV
jgi:transcriptional regulator with XRE-family HTH domain